MLLTDGDIIVVVNIVLLLLVFAFLVNLWFLLFTFNIAVILC